MWIAMSPQFREEAERYRLAFTCEACLHFCPERATCAIQYPPDPHRAERAASLADGERLYFCKMFEAV